jgi:hypothetical protein
MHRKEQQSGNPFPEEIYNGNETIEPNTKEGRNKK